METPSRAQLVKAELIEQVALIARGRLPAERAELAVAFIAEMYDNIAPNDLARERPENLYGAALSLLAFAEVREHGQPKVRVYNPRLDEHGWHCPHTVVEIINEDMPFLVDSVTAELNRAEASIRLVIHPMYSVERDEAGRLRNLRVLGEGDAGWAGESFMQMRVRAQAPERHEELKQGIVSVLADVRAAVEDFQPMRRRSAELVLSLRERPPPDVPPAEVRAAIELLEWLNEGNFVYLGFRSCRFEQRGDDGRVSVRPEQGLGLLRDPSRPVFDTTRPTGPGFLKILKANYRSTVHRRAHMDVVIVPQFSDSQPSGEYLIVGLFTLVAYSRSPQTVPVLRDKIARVFKRAGFSRESHDGKALWYILETYPRDELFQMDESDLLDIATGILYLQHRQRVALFVRRDPFERFVSCLVYVPRDRFHTALRLRIQEILARAYRGSTAAYYTHVTDEPLARVHVIIKMSLGKVPDVDIAAIERMVLEATRSWEDRLEEALVNDYGEELGSRYAMSYLGAFPAGYREDFDEVTAVHDIAFIEAALETGEVTMNLYHKVEAKEYELKFKIFSAGRFLALSDVLPMLENMGVNVIGEEPYEVRIAGRDQLVFLHDFSVETEGRVPIELSKVKEAFQTVFARVMRGVMENDALNSLVLHAGLRPREVTVVRAYAKYLRQLGSPFSQAYMQQTLRKNPRVARLLVDLFSARFDPVASVDPSRLLAELKSSLEAVKSLDEDRILRAFSNLIQATVRTNFYQEAASGVPKSYLSLKFDCSRIEQMPPPRPFREIFVFSPRLEGVHLRFGRVARGGLRWSDRLEDFRTEVLGLVKAQQVKNAVIVPVGAKGGFVVKRPPLPEAGRDALVTEGIECYKLFISGLLDLTDNLDGARAVTAPSVRRHDDDDPYLVVAADKGTASFSDIANGVSEAYGFWLGDAFASGGSAGYDHKKMGITARGAWESVKRHFRELGKDIQRETFSSAGVGDMNGDVFGNAMLLSPHMKLVAAFNHAHIFVDPDPDPETSWLERKRLFDLPRSSWKDYDPARISKGGGVFERAAKSVTVTAEMAQVLGLQSSSVTPAELVRAILRMNVDLLWFGGIGTFVKAEAESHADVGDRANDAVRVDAEELAARVIGEGANLGITQAARVAFSLAGGHCNTDFIDNSAGVDCSDHEVNIKILLGEVERAGNITRKQRDELLREMTEEVAALVLRDNYLQTQALTVTHQCGVRLLDRLSRFIRALEKRGELDRALEGLPDDEALVDRQKLGLTLTRPELAVLLSYAKNALYSELVSSEVPEDPYLEQELAGYFPEPLRASYAPQILSHRLRREIIATAVANDIVNRQGITFVYETRERTGMPSPRVSLAYIAAREIVRVKELYDAIERLDNVARASTQATMLLECGRLVDRVTVWLLREHGLSFTVGELIDTYAAGMAVLAHEIADLVTEADRAIMAERVSVYLADHVPEALARRVASLPLLLSACDIVRIAGRLDRATRGVAVIYYGVGRRFGFEWLRRAASRLPTDRAWDKQAVSALIDDLFGSQRELTHRILEREREREGNEAIEAWGASRKPLLLRNEQLLAELEAAPATDFAMLAVASRNLKSLLSG